MLATEAITVELVAKELTDLEATYRTDRKEAGRRLRGAKLLFGEESAEAKTETAAVEKIETDYSRHGRKLRLLLACLKEEGGNGE
jgi:hypothetical protein